MSRKIGILGSGIVARTLGKGFLEHNYAVMMGTRDTSKLKDWTNSEGNRAKVGSFADAAVFGDIVVLAVAGRAAKSALQMAGADNLIDKTIIDTCNPIDETPPENGVLKFFTSLDESLMEQLQKDYPQSHFVKAFNCVGNAFMVNPSFESKPTMFICGEINAAKKEVAQILDEFGWEVADMGNVQAARSIEPLCILWCIPGLLNNEWSHAFKLLKK